MSNTMTTKHTPGPSAIYTLEHVVNPPHIPAYPLYRMIGPQQFETMDVVSLDDYRQAMEQGPADERIRNENNILAADLAEARRALDRIANYETRSDRRHKGMVDASEIEACRRIARAFLARNTGE